MNINERQLLAEKLRDQGLADLLVARMNRAHREFRVGNVRVNRNCVVISKSQQAAEKLLKSYFVWHGENINPFRGHTPMKDVLAGAGGETPRLLRFRTTVRRGPNGLLAQATWLENLAPAGAPNGVSDLSAIEVSDLSENTEYPFFSKKLTATVCPAEYFDERQAGGAVRAAYLLCKTIAKSDDTVFGEVVQRFVEDYPLDREI